ncbi:hypothetical protein ACLQ3D_10605 [Micromonospora vinacea]|uniref:hypothetical protein n=1 Tax=Micromonospora vinacea TaxID=709878 RepID=UPI003CE953C1
MFVEQLLELLLWKRQGVQRRIGQPGEVKMHPSEREAGSRTGPVQAASKRSSSPR